MTEKNPEILIPAEKVPVKIAADICVIGGSCTEFSPLSGRRVLGKKSFWMIDADRKAFGALRVMVNLNQCGEAAGVAASLCLDRSRPVQKTDIAEVRAELNRGGSLLPD